VGRSRRSEVLADRPRAYLPIDRSTSRSEVLAGRSSRFEVAVDRSSVDFRCWWTDLMQI
jgi:hypothetical protein